ncbi:Hsp20/alpha crystallin family protein [Methanonatronarchaeum sp. AMET6-2]|uniref:Hsp20/alpha crystallin family protein n=1 Tax=Methanonatronarchaeum sp. AMET6-2 TaxID=2933293 RepID=UPI0011F51265|nr:Hsp20/alpha crystallin family protein [Methanonatronarchaeum sp. AMET6-2]RZN61723.1 MAG: Hsp20/alpha crystallin family protein [Methanonatronarchaeia archaeon]UOY10121.1 Hsp20/alpha crystallin family protein [Methanonatronarchaeum sp. AMET6-2]
MNRDKDPFDELFEKVLRDFFDREHGEMSFVDIFEEMWPQLDEVDEERLRKAVDERRRASGEGPFRFGFTVRMDQSGKPEVRSFGDRVEDKGREPLVDVFDEDDEIVVTAEMPGVEESDISIDVRDDRLVIEAVGESDRYAREVSLPRSVDPDSIDMNYRNGVLSLRLKPS